LIGSFRSFNFLSLYLNTGLPGGFFKSVKDYLQPLLVVFIAGIPLIPSLSKENQTALLIGLVYFIIYLITSWASKSSGKFSRMTGSLASGLNISYILLLLSGVIAGISYHYEVGIVAIVFFILIFFVENTRRPVAVAYISEKTDSRSLATFLSLDSQMRSLSAIILSPLIGYLADLLSPGLGLSSVAILLILLFPIIRISAKK
jgi:hypothetical protein